MITKFILMSGTSSNRDYSSEQARYYIKLIFVLLAPRIWQCSRLFSVEIIGKKEDSEKNLKEN